MDELHQWLHNGANLVAVGKLQYLNNVHLAGALTMAGNMARPNVIKLLHYRKPRRQHLLRRSIGRWDLR